MTGERDEWKDLPSQRVQRSQYLQEKTPNLDEGQAWFLVDAFFMSSFTSYLGLPPYGAFVSPGEENQPDLDPEALPPGQIDNSKLIQGCDSAEAFSDGDFATFASKTKEMVIRADVSEQRDFCLVSEGQWRLLKRWYGGTSTREIRRQVVKACTGRKHLFIEIRPLLLWVADEADGEKKPLMVSRTTSVGDFRKLAADLCYPQEPAELWQVGEEGHLLLCKEGDIRSLEECEFTNFNTFRFRQEAAASIPNGNGDAGPIILANGPAQRPAARRGALNGGDVIGIHAMNDEADKPEKPARIGPGFGLIGLQNLGNTCFMNSALQCLSNTDVLTQFFISGGWKTDLNRDNPLGMKGKLAEGYASIVRQLWGDKESYSVSPHEFKRVVGSFAPQFVGYAQHDSQELLAFLIDGLHEDLNRIHSKPATEIPTGDGSNDVATAKLAWERHKLRNDSFVQDTFSAQYRSELVCPDAACNNISVTFDPFNCVTLQLPQATDVTVSVVLRYLDATKRRRKMAVKMPKGCSMEELRAKLSTLTGIKQEHLLLADIKSCYARTVYRDTDSVTKLTAVHAYELAEPPSAAFMAASMYYSVSNQPDDESESGHIHVQVMMRKPGTLGWDAVGTPFFVALPARPLSGNNVRRIVCSHMARFLKGYRGPAAGAAGGDEGGGGGGELLGGKFTLKKIDSQYQRDGDVIEGDDPATPMLRERALLAVDWSDEGRAETFDEDAEELLDEDEDADNNGKGEKGPLTLDKLFELFVATEVLSEQDTWYCPKCKQHQRASKTMALWSAPRNLVINLKRFSQEGYWGRDKLETLVKFPVEGLDLSQYVRCPENESAEGLIYDLYGVVNHYGGSNFGHYTAYCLSPGDKKWHLFDDSSVSDASPDNVITPAAYVLFYQRRGAAPPPQTPPRQPVDPVEATIGKLTLDTDYTDVEAGSR